MRMILWITAMAAALSAQQTNVAQIAAPPTNDVVSMALSPDGQKLVYVGLVENRRRLWVRTLSTNRERALPDTEGVTLPFPFWSPDSKSVGFFSDGKLKRIDVESGSPQTLVTGVNWARGGTWSQNGTILYSSLGIYNIVRVSDSGGATRAVTLRETPQQFTHLHPQFLPDGRTFLFYLDGFPAVRGIYSGTLDSPVTKRLLDSESAGVYASGRLLFVRDGTLFAQDFDPARLTLSGVPSRIAEDVPVVVSRPAVSVSSAGDIAYRTGSAGSTAQLTWFDRSGKTLETVGAPFMAGGAAPALSPDGRTLIVQRTTGGNIDLWTVDMSSRTFARFTSDPARDNYPAWSPDGRRIAFSSNRSGSSEMFEKPFGQSAVETLMMATAGLRHPMDWSQEYLLYRKNSPDLWALQTLTLAEIPILAPPPAGTEIRWPQFSPDGKWVAFQSNQSGNVEIHIHGPFAPPSIGSTSARVSTNGGAWPRWRGDGKELFYLAPDGMLMAVPIEIAANGQSFMAGTPQRLFAPPVPGWDNSNFAQQYLISRDGQRILVVASVAVNSPIKVIKK
jgi:Tol biopolymer transport system component